MEKIPCAILGCTGLVGQFFVKLLKEHPIFEITLITASDRSAGKKFGECVNWIVGENIPEKINDMEVEYTSEESILNSGAKIIFSALPSSIAGPLEESLRKRGFFVFSNSSSHRMDSNVPILIPEINPDHLQLAEIQKREFGGFIITNSNCTTSGLALALKPLSDFGIKRIFMSSYQSISGAGRRGLPSMDILGNAIPFIKEEEEKVERETKKILGKLRKDKIENLDSEIVVNCCRIPVRVGHLESVMVELKKDVSLKEIIEVLEKFEGEPQKLKLPTAPEKPLIVRLEEERPQPEIDSDSGFPERAKGMAVSIGRIRKKGKFLCFFLLVNNLIRGSAGGSILNAEFAYYRGMRLFKNGWDF